MAPHHQAVVSVADDAGELVLHDAVEHGVVLLGLVDHGLRTDSGCDYSATPPLTAARLWLG